MERIHVENSGSIAERCVEHCQLLQSVPSEARLQLLGLCAASGAYVSCEGPISGQGGNICRQPNTTKNTMLELKIRERHQLISGVCK